MEVLDNQAQAYSCQAMVSAVNGLRHLGKDEALKVLREYYSVKFNDHSTPESREMTIICVCRLLFTPPENGWKIPWIDYKYMMDSPGYALDAKLKFSLYPMALSDGVPFQLNRVWMRPNGFVNVPPPDEGQRHLDLCKTLNLLLFE